MQLNPAQQTVTVSDSVGDVPRTRTFPLRTASRSDKALLTGALAQTLLLVNEREADIRVLQEQLALANKQIFGTSSEKKSRLLPQQQDDTTPNSNVAPESPAAPANNVVPFKRRTGRKALPAQLPRTRQEHRLPPEGICPRCAGALRPLPPEITEQLIVVPAKVEVVEHVRHKAVCRCCEAFITAPMPKSMVEGSSYGSASFLAYIACNKYQLGMPYYRQEKLFRQSHIAVNRTTMANLMNTSADRIAALFQLLKEALLRQAGIHADETMLQVLRELGRDAETTSFMWLYCSAVGASCPVILFDYQETRAGAHPRAFLAGFTGYLQVDGYSGYNAVENVTRVGCMAHIRRGFVKALDAIPKEKRAEARATWVVEQIAVLYRIEKQFANATHEERKQARQQCSLPVMNDIKIWLDQHEAAVLPKSLLGKAIHYALGQWDYIMVYLSDGRLSIDNNIAERAIKDLVIGRRAWLFADRPEGANTIAVMHSLVQTAVANGLDPYRYLLHVFETMPSMKTREELEKLLPWNVILPDKAAPSELAA